MYECIFRADLEGLEWIGCFLPLSRRAGRATPVLVRSVPSRRSCRRPREVSRVGNIRARFPTYRKKNTHTLAAICCLTV